MRQWALQWRKNTRSCQWIHKSSAVHMDTLCDHMFHALLIFLTLYCSAHLLICLTHDDKPSHTHTHSMFYALWAWDVQGGPVSVMSAGRGVVEIVICVRWWCHCVPLFWLVQSNSCHLLSTDFITVSYSHIHTHTYTQTFVSIEETLLQPSAPPVRGPQWHPKLFIVLTGLY